MGRILKQDAVGSVYLGVVVLGYATAEHEYQLAKTTSLFYRGLACSAGVFFARANVLLAKAPC